MDASLLRAMAESILHRGPDAEGIWQGPGVGLAHRRLSIIDLAEGSQPMADATGSLRVVFNGEIYNYPELRESLLRRGHPLKTHSDTETLLYLYRDFGAELVHHLRGMYAFAIYDSERETLLLARDRVGQKPLYYLHNHDRIIFGSEIKPLLIPPDVDRALDERAIDAYLAYGFIPGDLSIYRSIHKLRPGHVLEVQRHAFSNSQPRRYWSLPQHSHVDLTHEQWVVRLREKASETVKCHRISDVPVGAFLSGGVDSSAMVAEMSTQSDEPLKTFAIGFHEDRFSELPYARMVAQRFGTDHFEQIVTPDVASDFERLIHHYDEPFADSSALPTMAVARVASEHVKVVISGDGGDEAFGGYSRYLHDLREARIREALPKVLRRGLLSPIAKRWPRYDWLPRPLRLKSLLTNLSREPDLAYCNTLELTTFEQRQQIYPGANRGVRGAELSIGPDRFVTECYPRHGDELAAMTACDVGLVLPDDFLVKVDRASMAVGLEVRPPMVDHEFLEMAASIPSSLKIRDGEGKWILKKAYEDTLPHEILYRRKQGFEIPVDQWMRGPLKERLSETFSADGPLSHHLEIKGVNALMRAHQRGLGRYGGVLWSLFVLGEWMRKYTSGPVPSRMQVAK